MKTRQGRKRETSTVATVAHSKCCENVHGLAFCCHSKYLYDFSIGNLYFCMNLLITPVMVGLIELALFVSCVNLCSNLSLAVGK